MPVSPLHRQVAGIAPEAAAGYGFALGGGNALLAYGIITRPTQDVDLFSNREGGLAAARGREPVIMDVGPVLDIEDVAGGKVCALAGRVEPRDYADTATLLETYSPAQLIGFARQLDPGLTDRDFVDAGLRLDQIPDDAFTSVGLGRQDVTALRERFAAWPRVAPQRYADRHAGQMGKLEPDAVARDLEPGTDMEAGK
jgi:hypothetical protein